jgi:roadblock/LC7 domain-containing protein
MAFTQTQLDALDGAIAAGVLTVRTADGKLVTYQSMGDMLKARDLIASSLAAQSGSARAYPRHQLADFSDN